MFASLKIFINNIQILNSSSVYEIIMHVSKIESYERAIRHFPFYFALYKCCEEEPKQLWWYFS